MNSKCILSHTHTPAPKYTHLLNLKHIFNLEAFHHIQAAAPIQTEAHLQPCANTLKHSISLPCATQVCKYIESFHPRSCIPLKHSIRFSILIRWVYFWIIIPIQSSFSILIVEFFICNVEFFTWYVEFLIWNRRSELVNRNITMCSDVGIRK